MRDRYVFNVAVLRADVELVEIVQIPAVQADDITNADEDQVAHGDEPTQRSPEEHDDGEQIARRADDDENERVDAQTVNNEQMPGGLRRDVRLITDEFPGNLRERNSHAGQRVCLRFTHRRCRVGCHGR